MSENRVWAHVWMALYRSEVLWGGPYPCPAFIAARRPL
jgi:hypothetical protein